jgi:hypothetical protein
VAAILIVFVADVLHQFIARHQARAANRRERFGVRTRVVYSHFDLYVAQIGSRVALDGVQFLLVRVPETVKPEAAQHENPQEAVDVALVQDELVSRHDAPRIGSAARDAKGEAQGFRTSAARRSLKTFSAQGRLTTISQGFRALLMSPELLPPPIHTPERSGVPSARCRAVMAIARITRTVYSGEKGGVSYSNGLSGRPSNGERTVQVAYS